MQNRESDKMIQNLDVCGCDGATIERFMTMLNAGKKKKPISTTNECISRLDFLAAQVEKH